MSAPTGKRKHTPKNRKTKSFLEFDDKARSEYLRGFQKRKNERRKLAREKHDKKVMDERKELLKQARDQQKSRLRQEAVIIPEIQHLVDPTVFDLPDHTVTIADIGEVDYVGKSGMRLGFNTGQQNKPEEEEGEENENQEDEGAVKPVKNKSLKQKLAACSNQLSAQKMQVKKLKKKQMLKQKLQTKKKGKGKRKLKKKK
ncbi:nucleolar protein 12 [Aplysia californica]|uniref:Nucleolar protein 12 n=1 Tax=Aplysia californica TaxID=6500 RepID=A0ABM1A220_APLCA|nr:nucleolar protein 12 [Aplysia californica]